MKAGTEEEMKIEPSRFVRDGVNLPKPQIAAQA